MSMLLMVKAFGINVGNASRKLVLLKLADNANDKGECWPSYQHIADQCEVSRRTAMNHIEALCAAGLVSKVSRKGPKGNASNTYLLNLDGGEKTAPGGGEKSAPHGEKTAPDSETVTPPPGEMVAPGISHSFESVSEPVNESSQHGADAPAAGHLVIDSGDADEQHGPRCAIPEDMPGPKDQSSKTYRAWANYALCYRKRYGVFPIWNQRTAGQLSQLVDRVGAEIAPGVAAHYVQLNNQFYVSKGHPVGLMLSDCETIAMQMQTGSHMTSARARQIDSTQSNASAADDAKRLIANGWED
ncbi:helix-turn-helix domain-containing protein [Kushneria konosiri]|uniref:Helix-turn-helix domain-containing protein n=1 Tax=Kushneria konosiri TaxID=698828 RepID=A0A2Z2H2X5_9GAMM|nr:helix-turn-helix domain-containing protein [Kushneria konosiri]ARS51522.1 hypothetical protein B9G99_00240 [Kushneria konosiri]